MSPVQLQLRELAEMAAEILVREESGTRDTSAKHTTNTTAYALPIATGARAALPRYMSPRTWPQRDPKRVRLHFWFSSVSPDAAHSKAKSAFRQSKRSISCLGTFPMWYTLMSRCPDSAENDIASPLRTQAFTE